MKLPTPEEILKDEPFVTPQMLGYKDNVLPSGGGVVQSEIEWAYDYLAKAIPVPLDSEEGTEDYKKFFRALKWLTISRLFIRVAQGKAFFVGLVGGRSGQTNIPTGAADAILRFVDDYYARILGYYPLLVLPSVGDDVTDGGSWVAPRTVSPN